MNNYRHPEYGDSIMTKKYKFRIPETMNVIKEVAAILIALFGTSYVAYYFAFSSIFSRVLRSNFAFQR